MRIIYAVNDMSVKKVIGRCSMKSSQIEISHMHDDSKMFVCVLQVTTRTCQELMVKSLLIHNLLSCSELSVECKDVGVDMFIAKAVNTQVSICKGTETVGSCIGCCQIRVNLNDKSFHQKWQTRTRKCDACIEITQATM
jgi:hypothetical protein